VAIQVGGRGGQSGNIPGRKVLKAGKKVLASKKEKDGKKCYISLGRTAPTGCHGKKTKKKTKKKKKKKTQPSSGPGGAKKGKKSAHGWDKRKKHGIGGKGGNGAMKKARKNKDSATGQFFERRAPSEKKKGKPRTTPDKEKLLRQGPTHTERGRRHPVQEKPDPKFLFRRRTSWETQHLTRRTKKNCGSTVRPEASKLLSQKGFLVPSVMEI